MSMEFARGIMSDGDYALFVNLQEVDADLNRRLSLATEMIPDGISME